MFDMPDKALTLNERLHWAARAERVKTWRHATRAHAHLQLIEPKDLGPSLVQVAFRFPQKRRRDPHNYFATVKPIIDGLVDAGVWPDDTPAHVKTLEPELFVVAGHPAAVHIELWSLDQMSDGLS